MLLPALMAFSSGDLTPEQVRRLHDALQLEENTPRTEGYGAKPSIAHRPFTDEEGHPLILELARTDETEWVFALWFEKGGRPSSELVENHRVLFRGLIDELGLTLLEIEPPATADEVGKMFVDPQPGNPEEGSFAPVWDLPYDRLDHMWFHLGLPRDAPREVKAVRLREVMGTRVWSVAPERLRNEAEEFLRGI
ncbi:hypothetical protein [Nocardiopsis algeriensis]|uniref:Uncharacterized protein n=1 Tax=Nocardiopsis algeriensis TaxID=1478215 RepID=A0A841ITN5_9ACTN|nr:hypothetical protein [Nocardiopsis algeriensis]MBB6121590.1 hypothetical protein [Nocardiopsis algeriensis]